MDKNIFVQNVKYWCEKRGIPPTVACKDSGAGRDLLVNLQRGSLPSVAKVQLLAQYLGVTTSDLLGEAQKSSPPSEEDRLLAGYDALSARNREKLEEYLAGLKYEQREVHRHVRSAPRAAGLDRVTPTPHREIPATDAGKPWASHGLS